MNGEIKSDYASVNVRYRPEAAIQYPLSDVFSMLGTEQFGTSQIVTLIY